MKRRDFYKNIIIMIFAVSFVFSDLNAETKGVKTSYKQYSIYTYENEDVLCEPYIVNKDDWLYKIFRKKGEISEKDFPQFLLIFKEINPDISNIDAIEPGINILIPLKKIKKQDYDENSTGTISVPVIEFSTTPEELNLKPYLEEHRIAKGETVSTMIDKEFIDKSGQLTQEGLKAFQLANPNIQNINLVYEGSQIFLPDPAIKKQAWFRSLFSSNTSSQKSDADQGIKITAHELAQLKRYASLIGGTLLNSGKMYFPGAEDTNTELDLSKNPVIETHDGSKILIVTGHSANQNLLEHIQAHWRDLKTQTLSESVNLLKYHKAYKAKHDKILEYQKMVKALLAQTTYDYLPNAKISFNFNKIALEARFGRVVRKETTDLLINFGNVYGTALDIIKKKEFEVISITPKLSVPEAISRLFTSLGYQARQNPSFFTGNSVEPLKGIYLVKNDKKHFIPLRQLSAGALTFLEKQDISILTFNLPDYKEK